MSPFALVQTQGFESVEDYCQKVILVNGRDAEDIVFPITARSLNIRLRIAFMERVDNEAVQADNAKVPYLDFSDLQVSSDSSTAGDERPFIHLQLRPGHYDLMYRQKKSNRNNSVGSTLSDLAAPFSPGALTGITARPVLLSYHEDIGRTMPSISGSPPTLDKTDRSSWSVSGMPILHLVEDHQREVISIDQDREALDREAFDPRLERSVAVSRSAAKAPRSRRRGGSEEKRKLLFYRSRCD
mmetsp:Transcript_47339/g.75635  ORF Transcript_47339/g.75635 Transcript_47339/m.75635 type:complete len:242 (-) Transcript_47339:164-889(-)